MVITAILSAACSSKQGLYLQKQVVLKDDFRLVKTYGHYCPIAHSLGLVGERWTLLVVRELMHGPKRYTDLADHLPGIGTNVLALRLKGSRRRHRGEEEAAAVLVDRVRADAGRTAQLRPVLHELARFGARLMGPPPPVRSRKAGSSGRSTWRSPPLPRRDDRVPDRRRGGVARRLHGRARDRRGLRRARRDDATGFYHLVVDRQLEASGSTAMPPRSTNCSTASR